MEVWNVCVSVLGRGGVACYKKWCELITNENK